MINLWKRSAFFRSLLMAILAFLIWGSWAYWANVSQDAAKAPFSALGQGLLSFMFTLVGSLMIEWLFQFLPTVIWPPYTAALMVSFTMVLLSIAMHWWIGTPSILLTVLPNALVSLLYCLTYSMGLERLAKANWVEA